MSQSEVVCAADVDQPNLSAYENNRRTPSPEVLDRIRRAVKVRPSIRVFENRDEIRRIVTEHHATAPRLVGSMARGEDGPDSDLDLLVEFTSEASILDEVGLRLTLTDLLGIPVDILTEDTIDNRLRGRVLTQAVPL